MRWIACVIASAALHALAQGDDWKLQQGVHVYPYTSGDPAKLAPHVVVFLPPGYEQRKSPLLVLLHGAGQKGNDVEKLKGNRALKYAAAQPSFPFITASPQAAEGTSGFDPASMNALIEELVRRLPVDPARIYLTGASMGGNSAWEIAAEYPQRFAAVVPISSKPDVSRACRMKDTPVWAFHNDQDKLFAPKNVQEMVEAVRKCQGSAKLTVYPDRPVHDAWTAAYTDPALYDWLASQHR